MLAEKAQDEIESTLRITVLNPDNHIRQDVYLFVNVDHCTWREEYIDSKYKYIYFYRVKDKYGEFSNFYPPSDDVDKAEKFRLFIKGKSWKTTEHFYQAMKFEGLPEEEEVRNAKNAYWAAKLGNKLSPIREDWNKIKDNVMYEAVFAKFNQNEDLKELLLNTGNAMLIEHTKNDSYWADGEDGSGLNKLGKILMKVREILKDK